MIELENVNAINNPIIASFVELLEKTVGDGVLEFSDIEEKPFMPFWKYFIIAKHEKEKRDFKIIFFGTSMQDAYEKDHTGSYLSEMNLKQEEEAVRKLHLDVINNNKRLYANGHFKWLKEDHRNWYQVKVPLARSGQVEETLTVVCYD